MVFAETCSGPIGVGSISIDAVTLFSEHLCKDVPGQGSETYC